MKTNKKTIGAILATMLLLLASISFYFVLSSWFNNYESSFFTSYREDNLVKNYIKADDLIDNTLYLESDILGTIVLLNIYDKNKNLKCTFNSGTINIGTTNFDVSTCSLVQGEVYNIVGLSSSLNFERNLVRK